MKIPAIAFVFVWSLSCTTPVKDHQKMEVIHVPTVTYEHDDVIDFDRYSGSCYISEIDPTSMGPFQVIHSTEEPGFSIYYPDALDKGIKFPVIAWANGMNIMGGFTDIHYGRILRKLASHGYVVIASHSPDMGYGSRLIGGLDTIASKNFDPSHKFYGKLLIDDFGVLGHSLGGTEASLAENDDDVVAVVNIMGVSLDSRKPTAFISGDKDRFRELVDVSFFEAKGEAFKAIIKGADHTHLGGNQGMDKMAEISLGWFNCHICGDVKSCRMFMPKTGKFAKDKQLKDVCFKFL